jgi:hypothetical protein
MKNVFRQLLAFSATAIVSVSLASAAQITQTFTLGDTTLDITTPTDPGVFTFNKFLSAGGTIGDTLNSVQVRISMFETLLTLSVTNTAEGLTNSFQYVTFSNINAVGTAPSADRTLLNNALNANGGGGNYGDIDLYDTGNLLYGVGETKTFVPPTLNFPDDSALLTAASVTPYNTTGNFTLGFRTQTFQSVVGGGGNGAASQTTIGGGTVTVIYNYTSGGPSTPEPATMALLGSALIGLGVFGRKRLSRR